MAVSPASLALAALLGASAPAEESEPSTPSEFVERAQAQFRDGDYNGAAQSLSRAYELEPSPATAYAWAQAARLSGDCETAVERYQEFLDSEPDEGPASAAQANLDRCEEQLAARREEQRRAEEEEQRRQEEEAAAEQARQERLAEERREKERLAAEQAELDARRPWIADPLGASLSGVGVAGLVAGVAVLASGSRQGRRASEEGSHEEYVAMTNAAITKQRVGGVLMGIGAAVFAGGIVRYAIVAKRDKREGLTLVVAPNGVGIRSRF